MLDVRAAAALDLPRLDATPLQERIASILRDRIISGELPGGTRLSIASLAEQFGVSRQPVASALQRLSHEGYVVVRPRSGTVVTDFDADHFLQALELRLLLEEFAAPLIVARATDEAVGRLERLLAETDARFPTWDHYFSRLGERQRLGREFHRAIIELSGNAPLIATYRFVYEQCHRVGPAMSAARMKARTAEGSRRGSPINAEHHAMIRALRERDAGELARAFRAEVERIRRDTPQTRRAPRPISRDRYAGVAGTAPTGPAAV